LITLAAPGPGKKAKPQPSLWRSAGLALLWRKSEGRMHAFRENGIVIGPFPDSVYANAEFALQAGDRLLLYTDGITEAENATGELYGEERLLAFVAANAALPVGRFGDALLAELAGWSGGTSDGTQRDDVTLIVVDFQG
jgi:sigma-B regulation protein RsbU (phosphoserine phosphatase)